MKLPTVTYIVGACVVIVILFLLAKKLTTKNTKKEEPIKKSEEEIAREDLDSILEVQHLDDKNK